MTESQRCNAPVTSHGYPTGGTCANLTTDPSGKCWRHRG